MGDEPPIPEGLAWVWNAFWALGTCRSVGMGVGAIPWTAVDAYALRYGIMGDAFESFHFLIQRLDSIALGHWREGKDGRGKDSSATD